MLSMFLIGFCRTKKTLCHRALERFMLHSDYYVRRREITKEFSKSRLLLYLMFIILVFFPWVSFGLNSFDVQPWILFFGLAIVLIFIKRQGDLLFLLVVISLPIVSQLIAVLFGSDIDFMLFQRGVASYIIFACVYIIQRNSLNLYPVFYKYIFLINLFYLVVGFIQITFPEISFDWAVHGRTTGVSGDRGVYSLSVEPTAFGLFLLILSVIHLVSIDQSNRKKVYFIVALNALAILFLAQSSTAAIYMLLGVILLGFSGLSVKDILFIWFLTFFMGITYIASHEDSRLLLIFSNFLSGDFLEVFLLDESAFDRIMATIHPLIASYKNLFMPGGFYLVSSLESIDISWIDSSLQSYHAGNKIMSLWGGLIAETGFFGILLLFIVTITLIHRVNLLTKIKRRKYYLLFLFLFLLGFSSVGISLSVVPFTLALIISKIEKDIEYVQK